MIREFFAEAAEIIESGISVLLKAVTGIPDGIEGLSPQHFTWLCMFGLLVLYVLCNLIEID